MNVYYTDSWVMHVTLGDDFLGLCDKKVVINMCPIWNVYGVMIIWNRLKGKDYWKCME